VKEGCAFGKRNVIPTAGQNVKPFFSQIPPCSIQWNPSIMDTIGKRVIREMSSFQGLKSNFKLLSLAREVHVALTGVPLYV